MGLNELIKKGETFYNQVQSSEFGGDYIKGEDYEQWITEVAIHMEKESLPSVIKNRLDKTLENAVGNGAEYLETILGILKAVNKNGNK
ncbi:hypothetical protein SAMN02745784_02980 [Tissierella praeacuta DSM 18095]|uniref:Uncharacterized protein n=1 Tax=Tissierella praeacuta DSM 18095 TaxID=1123404 RepID=A0A1M4ZAW5_9FIRM|nr:hypothetical protein [Tissierella praeacuta]TCU74244.1 hypothetical protein EV204_104282 [Tissierella praeacuta]SHF15180.1 hypothetical protein SAMN02745784_02980 [Tissierella praeacuta DSM 18095]SUO99533.1 Uncharacterised protein [Tissierella praeacuta]